MGNKSKLSLEVAYTYFIEVIFGKRQFEDIEPYISPQLWLYGTAEHERISGPEELKKLIKKQNAELEEITVKFQRTTTPHMQSYANDTVVVLIEEMLVQIVEVNSTFIFRITSIWEKTGDKWILSNVHSSTPDTNVYKSKAFPVEGIIKKNEELEAKIEERTEELRISLEKLKATQSQLIQSEKMASLGELTAGIAHEIQNPLNFVNNFSEVNDELLDDLKEAIANSDQEEIEAIYNDLKENESKIKHHGQRAEGIVKGMLQHSRTSTGEKEPTDINALADEYLRLAYHGMRAKDKSFNADFKTNFDPNLPKINLVPQDMGRVHLNLINNAFHGVSEKAARHSDPMHSKGVEPVAAASDESYKPEVLVSTRQLDDKIEISVRDNGSGIPDDIKDKIFQPFFTTKPTGQGAGLGLSLSYDIITKGHGGKIEKDSNEGSGATFNIYLPINTIE